MAHFAKLDENNVVTQVIVVSNAELIDSDGEESEAKGIEFCQRLLGGTWVQTSYNGNFRKNYAGVGYTYRADIDEFVPPPEPVVPVEPPILPEPVVPVEPPPPPEPVIPPPEPVYSLTFTAASISTIPTPAISYGSLGEEPQ
jgi:hypothetical protein